MIGVAVGKEYNDSKVKWLHFLFHTKLCLQRQILLCTTVFSGTEAMVTCKALKWYTHKSGRSPCYNFMIQIKFSVCNIVRKKALCLVFDFFNVLAINFHQESLW